MLGTITLLSVAIGFTCLILTVTGIGDSIIYPITCTIAYLIFAMSLIYGSTLPTDEILTKQEQQTQQEDRIENFKRKHKEIIREHYTNEKLIVQDYKESPLSDIGYKQSSQKIYIVELSDKSYDEIRIIDNVLTVNSTSDMQRTNQVNT